MYEVGAYNGTDPMSDLICDNYPMLLVMSRFGIALGFGDKSVGEVCESNGVDTETFLAVVNLLIGDDKREIAMENAHLSVSSLILYLRDSHTYFLEFKLPYIRRKLIEAIDCSDNDLSMVIIRYYDEYVAEVRKHMSYEEQTVFPYVETLLADGDAQQKYSIKVFSKQHSKVEMKLSELKNIIIKYYPARSSNELNGVLFDIFSCEQDMISHTEVEDKIFTPTVREIELQRKERVK